MTEYHLLKEIAISNKIFELGLKRFPEEVEFAAQYLSFLININDEPSELSPGVSECELTADNRCSRTVRAGYSDFPTTAGEDLVGEMEIL